MTSNWLFKIIKMNKSVYIIILTVFVFCSCLKPKNTDKDSNNIGYLDTTYPNLPILHLNGTSYENGYQHGVLMKNRIIELVELWESDIEKNYQISPDEFIKMFLDSTNYIPAIKKWTPELLEEIKGISDGAEIDFNTMFAFQLIDEIWTNSRLMELPHHCTSIGVNNFLKNESANYIAQNVDVPSFYHGFEILLDIKDNKSHSRKLVTTFVGYIGTNGLNKFIGITCNSLMDLKSSLSGLPVSCIVRGVLEKKSFEDAERFIKEIKHASGQNYIIGSQKHISSFECSSDLITEYWPDSTKYYTYHANRSITNKSYHPSYIEYVKTLFKATPEDVNFGDPRLKSIESRILKNDSIDIVTIKNALAEKPVCNSNTWVSTIMEFNDNYNEFKITPGKPDSSDYILFRMKK